MVQVHMKLQNKKTHMSLVKKKIVIKKLWLFFFFLQPEYLHSATAIFPKQIRHHYSIPIVKPTRCTSVSDLFILE